MPTAVVITVSDRCCAGQRMDASGPLVEELLSNAGFTLLPSVVIPDEREQIEEELRRLCDEARVALLITTGGTGFAPRDVTPEATIAVCQRMAPGIAEAMRAHSLRITPRAMLSRGVAGIRKSTLIINLPGSPKGAKENLECVLPTLAHGIALLCGEQCDG